MAAPMVVKGLAQILSDPEVCKKLIDRMPELAETVERMNKVFPELLKDAMDRNDKTTEAFNTACQSALDMTTDMIRREDITLEEKKYFTDTMLTILDMMQVKDRENKQWLQDGLIEAGQLLLLGPLGLPLVYAREKKKRDLRKLSGDEQPQDRGEL